MALKTQYKDTQTKRIITSTIMMVIGAAFCGVGYWIGLSGHELGANGIETTAIISNKKKVKRRGGGSRTGGNKDYKRSTRYMVSYQFKTKDGRQEDQKSVSRAFFDSVKFGDKVPVRYIAADSSQNEIEIGTYNTNSWIAGGIGAVFVLLGAVILLLPKKNSNSQKFGRGTENKKELA